MCEVNITGGACAQQEVDAYIARALELYGREPDAIDVTFEELARICAAVDIPVTAIGGINARTMGSLAGTGVDGAAVVSAIFAAEDIEAATRELRCLAADAVGSR